MPRRQADKDFSTGWDCWQYQMAFSISEHSDHGKKTVELDLKEVIYNLRILERRRTNARFIFRSICSDMSWCGDWYFLLTQFFHSHSCSHGRATQISETQYFKEKTYSNASGLILLTALFWSFSTLKHFEINCILCNLLIWSVRFSGFCVFTDLHNH